MSHAAHSAHAPGEPSRHPAMAHDNIHLPSGATSALSTGLIGLGVLGLVATAIAGFTVDAKHAMSAALIGVMGVTGVSLGALFFVMVFHLTNAGWSSTIRRQFENVMSMLPVCFALFAVFAAVELFSGGVVASWLNEQVTVSEGYFIQKKAPYLNLAFIVVRAIIFFAIWLTLARIMWTNSVNQDRTGDRWLTAKSRFHASWGMLAFALSAAFFSFDWLKAVADYRFFSTMWGVYFFAGAIFATIPTVVIILALLRRSGRLKDAVTDEHFHDLGKLMFGFTVFWAYIGFSQYFLIWYSNIPEETAFYVHRKSPPWDTLTMALVIGHFIVPWYLLLWRGARRSLMGLAGMAAYMIVMHILDLYWIVRPTVDLARTMTTTPNIAGGLWIDAAGIIGVVALYAGLLARKVGSGPLVPLHDPRLAQALKHKNYV